MTAPMPSAVAAAFDAMPDAARPGLLRLRDLILDVAWDKSVPLTEALRRGQPAYLAPKGSTIRLGVPKTARFALFVHCQSRLIPDYLAAFPDKDRVEGTRAILFDDPDQVDPGRHGLLIANALTYHQR